MSKHTPGPWLVASSEYDENLSIIAPFDAPEDAPESSYNIAEVHGGLEKSQVAANARLIAAAPDMLAALQSICGAYEVYEYVPTYIQKARIAVAMAEGKRP